MTGKDIIVIISSGQAAMFATAIKSDDIQTRVDAIEKASSTQQEWREYIAGRKEWTFTVNFLVKLPIKLRNVLEVGKKFDITLRHISENVTLTGQALLTDCKQTHTVNSLCQGSFTFRGNGPLQ